MTSTELKSVSTFYTTNATNFSKTRVNPWPGTSNFVNKLPKDSLLLDIGCGNGRNMFLRDDIKTVGLEMSKDLCNIVKKKGGTVFHGNMTKLPFENNSIDNIICIAVYHHLDNNEDRKRALNEMYRVLKPNGKAFIQVWAMEQPITSRRKFLKRDEYVPWKNKDGTVLQRYYRIYPKGELENEISQLESRFNIDSVIYEEGNWINVISKK